MPASESPAGSALRVLAGLSALLFAGLALVPQPASAWEDPYAVADPTRPRPHGRMRPVPIRPAPPQAAIVSGYRPRNTNVPMYNEPPGVRSSGGPAW